MVPEADLTEDYSAGGGVPSPHDITEFRTEFGKPPRRCTAYYASYHPSPTTVYSMDGEVEIPPKLHDIMTL